MEDYLPILNKIGEFLLSINEKEIDSQERDYLGEIEIYTKYLIDNYEDLNPKKPELMYLKKK